jgi:hypothetical protein
MLEDLDDDHAPATARAGIRGWLGLTVTRATGVGRLRVRLWDVEQLTGSGDVPGLAAGLDRHAVVQAIHIVHLESAGYSELGLPFMQYHMPT